MEGGRGGGAAQPESPCPVTSAAWGGLGRPPQRSLLAWVRSRQPGCSEVSVLLLPPSTHSQPLLSPKSSQALWPGPHPPGSSPSPEVGGSSGGLGLAAGAAGGVRGRGRAGGQGRAPRLFGTRLVHLSQHLRTALVLEACGSAPQPLEPSETGCPGEGPCAGTAGFACSELRV